MSKLWRWLAQGITKLAGLPQARSGKPAEHRGPGAPPSGPDVVPMQRMTQSEYRRYLDNAEIRFISEYDGNLCPKADFSEFTFQGKLGQGGYATVFLVEHSQSGSKYALKAQIKEHTHEYVAMVTREKRLIWAMQSKFIVQLFYFHQDIKTTSLYTEYAAYGDLSSVEKPTEKQVKMYSAQMVLALEYIHEIWILHRDLHPRNVLMFGDGYVKLADFGIAKRCPQDRTLTVCGDRYSQSPEMLNQTGYGRDVDFWELGCFILRIWYTHSPLYEAYVTVGMIQDALLHPEEIFPAIESKMSSPMIGILRGLLAKKRHERLGLLHRGILDIKEHEWFSDINFLDVFNKDVPQSLPVEAKVPHAITEDDEPCLPSGREARSYGLFRDF